MNDLIGLRYRINRPILGNPAGSIGFVIETYEDLDEPSKIAVTILFENGRMDGFSAFEQALCGEFEGVDNRVSGYNFISAAYVNDDYRRGYWKWE